VIRPVPEQLAGRLDQRTALDHRRDASVGLDRRADVVVGAERTGHIFREERLERLAGDSPNDFADQRP